MEEREKERLDKLREGLKVAKKKSYHKSASSTHMYLCSYCMNQTEKVLARHIFKSLQVNFCQKLFFLKNMGRRCVHKLFWMSETISVHNMFFPGWSLEFLYIEHVIQWKSVVILWVSWCKIRASDKDLPVNVSFPKKVMNRNTLDPIWTSFMIN